MNSLNLHEHELVPVLFRSRYRKGALEVYKPLAEKTYSGTLRISESLPADDDEELDEEQRVRCAVVLLLTG